MNTTTTTKGESRKASKVTISVVEARFLGFASALNTKYDLSKLEEFENAVIEARAFVKIGTLVDRMLETALRAITRQPAGEKQKP